MREVTQRERMHVRFLAAHKRARGHTPMKPTSSRPAERPLEGGIGNSREFLEPLVHILVHTGHPPQKLAQEVNEICSGLSEPPHAWNPAYLNFLTALPGVIARWHTNDQFLNSKGEPLPLPLKSESISLASLIAQVLPNEDPAVVVDSLIKFQGIRREGEYYLPTDRQLRFTEENAWVYGLRALRGMLRTIEYNVTRAGPQDTIQERVAVSLHFPVRALAAFHRWLKGHAKEFLWGVYRNMLRHESQWKSGPTTRLSVAVFAFEEPMITGTSIASEAVGSDRADPATGGRRIRRRRKVSSS